MRLVLAVAAALICDAGASSLPVDPAHTKPDIETRVEQSPSHVSLSKIWQRNFKRYGDTAKAREETLKEIRRLDDVRDAGLSPEQTGIWVRFKSGSISGIMIGRSRH